MGLLNIIRRMHLRQKLSIREIARLAGVSRNTVAKHLAANTIEPKFATPERQSKIDPFAGKLAGWLKAKAGKSRKERRTMKQLHADLVTLGFTGSYARVAAFARRWQIGSANSRRRGAGPLCRCLSAQVRRSSLTGARTLRSWAANAPSCRWPTSSCRTAGPIFCALTPLQTHEMLFDAHWHAFRVFGGMPERGIYDSEAGPPSVRGLAERARRWTASVAARNGRATCAFWP